MTDFSEDFARLLLRAETRAKIAHECFEIVMLFIRSHAHEKVFPWEIKQLEEQLARKREDLSERVDERQAKA